MEAVPPALRLSSEEVAHLLAAACRAPSLHNSQPWRFRVEPDVIELWADPERSLPAADPGGREQRLACGAALYNLRLALQGCGVRPLVTLPADPERPDLLAVVRYGGRKPATPAQLRLLAAVPKRRTNRRPFTDEQVTGGERDALQRAAVEEGAWLHFVDDRDQRDTLARLAAQAHTIQQADPAFRAEVERWTAVADGRDDGIPAYSNEHRPSAHEQWVKRDFTGGSGRTTAAVGVRFEQDPAIAVISPYAFGVSADVTAGQAMQHVLLTATADGLATSFLSQIVEVEQTREQLRRLIGGSHSPRVVLRIGRGWPVPSTPRRAVADLLMPTAASDDARSVD
jgi:Nitroreductase family